MQKVCRHFRNNDYFILFRIKKCGPSTRTGAIIWIADPEQKHPRTHIRINPKGEPVHRETTEEHAWCKQTMNGFPLAGTQGIMRDLPGFTGGRETRRK